VTALNVKEKGDKEKRKEETKEKTIVCFGRKKEIKTKQKISLSLFLVPSRYL